MKKFTDEQKLNLEYVLKKFDHKQVEKFIYNAEILLEPASHVANEQSDSEDYHSMIDDFVKQIEALQKKTQKLYRLGIISNLSICRNETLKSFDCMAPERWNRLLDPPKKPKSYHSEKIKLMDDAREADKALEKLSSSLQQVRKKHTRKRGGKKPPDHHGICLNLGYFYFKAFNKMPSTTKTGPFIEVLKIILQALNLPCLAPTRLIKLSIPELKRGLEIERKHEEELQNR